MTSDDFRNDPALRGDFEKWLKMPIAEIALSVVTDQRPSRKSERVTADMIGIQLGRLYGYEEALDALRDLAKPLPQSPPEPDMNWNATKDD